MTSIREYLSYWKFRLAYFPLVKFNLCNVQFHVDHILWKNLKEKIFFQIFSKFMIFEKLWNFKRNYNYEFLIFLIRFWCKSILFYSRNLNSQKDFEYQRLQTRYAHLKMWKFTIFIIFKHFFLGIFRIFWRIARAPKILLKINPL